MQKALPPLAPPYQGGDEGEVITLFKFFFFILHFEF